MRWGWVTLLSLCACGRVGFDRADVSFDGGSDGPADGATDVFVPDGPRSAATFVQATGDTGTVTTGTVVVALPQDVVAGQLVVFETNIDAPRTISGLMDNFGSAYTVIGPYDADVSHGRMYLAYAFAAGSGPLAVTVVYDAMMGFQAEQRILVYNGAAPIDPIYSVGSRSGNAPTAQSADIVTTEPNSLALCLVLFEGATFTPGAGFVVRDQTGGDVYEESVILTPSTVQAVVAVDARWGALSYAIRGAPL